MLQILYTIRYFLCHSHVIRMPFLCLSYVNRMYSHVTHMSFVCHSYLLVCHSYVTPMCSYIICMYSYAIRMSLVCTRMSSVCHSYVIRISLVCHPHVTRIYSYAIRMSLVCHPYVTLMYSYAICMSLVCTLCHLYVTGRWFYHEPSVTAYGWLWVICSIWNCIIFVYYRLVFSNSMMLSRFSAIFFNSKPFDGLSLKILFNFIYKRMN